ncbi:MAG: 30S ribosomal protein S16 [Bacteroidetes bacterium]|nr:MAG: 30S ribosomal protein S16 [Bacteroidota bacterium]REK05095.1 MAG: 30S ribosomal protein S16 [Bacteroidota bacterium]REK32501.1 MAG: 30S ribosomal protein S16 [Bacteroidota bacterium]REK49052.1 MAG: 30S ribosomal protein S16 [Bacteroidota bacterium]
MPVKIRLARHGKKHNAYYHIVVADSRAPRDGKYIEVIGNYNPNTVPATIQINHDKALSWLHKGAQPTDTCRAILSYKGVLYHNHLLNGVKKGALTQEQAEAKFKEWSEAKSTKIDEKRSRVGKENLKAMENRIAEETKKKEAKMEAIRVKNTPPPAEEVAPETPAVENEAGSEEASSES